METAVVGVKEAPECIVKSTLVNCTNGALSMMLDHVFCTLVVHVVLLKALDKASSLDTDDLNELEWTVRDTLLKDEIEEGISYPVPEEEVMALLTKVQQFFMPTLKELVSSLSKDMDADEARHIMAHCYGLMGGVESIYSAYAYSRQHAFNVLYDTTESLDMDQFDVTSIASPDREFVSLDWSELNAYYYEDVFPYESTHGWCSFTHLMIQECIMKMSECYEDDELMEGIKNQLKKAIEIHLLPTSNFLINYAQTKEKDKEEYDQAWNRLWLLLMGVKQNIPRLGRILKYAIVDEDDYPFRDMMDTLDVLIDYYRDMFFAYTRDNNVFEEYLDSKFGVAQ